MSWCCGRAPPTRKGWSLLPKAAELFNPEKLTGFHDPFAGGRALPREAQRLGLEAYASALNQVAALISKAMIEIGQRIDPQPFALTSLQVELALTVCNQGPKTQIAPAFC